jgi:hypothetical protein
MNSLHDFWRPKATNLLQFWSRGDAYWASGINRIFIYTAAWLTLRYHLALIGFDTGSDHGIATWLAQHSAVLWQPHGLARLLIAPPSAGLVWVLSWIAMVTSLAAIVGIAGRVATVVSALTLALLVALTLSWQPYWSHGFNILCIVPLAFMWNGAPSLSVDALIRKYITKRPAPACPIWPSLLGQAAIALFLFAAFYAKLGFLRHTFTLDWIFSDNLRNSVAMPYALFGYPMTWWIKLLVAHPALYISAAAAHMVMQGFPICAIFTRNPYWRLAEGAMFVLGIALLYFVMTLGVGEWFLLSPLFVDWDYWISKALPRNSTDRPPNLKFWRSAPAYYSAGFMLLFVIVACTKSAWSNGFYPFSPMDFYSTVNDNVTFLDRIKALSFLHRPFRYWMDREITHHKSGYVNDYRGNFDSVCSYVAPHADDATKIALTIGRYRYVMANSGRLAPLSAMVDPWAPWRHIPPSVPRFVEVGTTNLALWCSIYSMSAYPAGPLPSKPVYTRLVSEYDAVRKRVLLASGTLDIARQTIAVRTYGFDRPKVALFYSPDPELSDNLVPSRPLPGRWINASTFAPVKANREAWFTTVEVTDEAGKKYEFWGPYLYGNLNDKP